MILYLILALLLIAIYFIPESYTPHGIQVGSPPIENVVMLILSILGSVGAAYACYIAAKQNLYGIVLSNVTFVGLLLILGADIWWYMLFALTLPPVVVVFSRIHNE